MRQSIRLTLATILGIGLLIALLAGPGTAQNPGVAQTDSQRGITVKAKYLTPTYLKTARGDPLVEKVGVDRGVVFAIALDTHAGDLSGYDFVKNALLRNDRGQQVTPDRWVATADGSHHRAGGLVFPTTDASGRPIGQAAKGLELVVRNLGGVPERSLRWTLPLD